MLPQKNRLCKKKDFDRVFKKGKGIFGKTLGIKAYKNKEFSYPRFGVIVSNKISKKAVERNLIKRRIRSILVQKYKEDPVCDVVIITLPSIKNQKFSEINKELDKCFIKLKKRI